MTVFGANAWGDEGDDKSKKVGVEQIGSTGATEYNYPRGGFKP